MKFILLLKESLIPLNYKNQQKAENVKLWLINISLIPDMLKQVYSYKKAKFILKTKF